MEHIPNDEQLEMMKKQWELMGIDPNLMLQHLNNGMEMAKETQKNMPGTLQENSAWTISEDKEEEEEFESYFEFDNDPSIKEDSDITDEAVLKAIACGSNLAFLNGDYLNTLSTFGSEDQILAMLELDWGIESREELLIMLKWLENKGHRKTFSLIWNNLKGVPGAEWASTIEETNFQLLTENDTQQDLQEKALNFVLGYNMLKNAGCFEKMKTPDILSWDLGRAINLIRWGYDVKFLRKEEAITLIQKYAAQMKEVYNSWDALSEGYLMGFMMWSGDEDELESLFEDHRVLLNHEDSPWLRIDW